MDILHIEWMLYYQRHSLCGIELHEVIQYCVHILQAHTYITIWYTTMHDNETHIPNDCTLHTKRWLYCYTMHLFIRTKLASYCTLHVAVSFQLIVYTNIKITKRYYHTGELIFLCWQWLDPLLYSKSSKNLKLKRKKITHVWTTMNNSEEGYSIVVETSVMF